MYRLWNYIFKWDYIVWRNFADSGIARIHKGSCGRAWYWRYKITSVIDEVKKYDQVIWLTCEPSKYLKSGDSRE